MWFRVEVLSLGFEGPKDDCRNPALPIIRNLPYGSFRKLGVPYLGVLILRILLFRVLDWGPPIFGNSHMVGVSKNRGSSTLNSRILILRTPNIWYP